MACGDDNLAELSDSELVSRWITGDGQAMAILYLRHSAEIVRYAAFALRDPEEAKDAAHDVWLRVIAFPRLEPGNFRGLLQTGIRNEILRRFKHGRVVTKHAAQLGRDGIQGAARCRYCDRCLFPKGNKSLALCEAHYARFRRGANEESMKQPIQPWPRRNRDD